MSDVRKWFMKQHDKGNASAPEKRAQVVQESSGRRKTSKYFATTASADASSEQKGKDETKNKRAPARETSELFAADDNGVKLSPAKKLRRDEDDFVLPNEKKKSTPAKPAKKLKNAAGVGVAKHAFDDKDDNEKDELEHKDEETPVKAGGRGKVGQESGVAIGGRGKGGGSSGRGGFMNFGE